MAQKQEHEELRKLCDLVSYCRLLKMTDVDIAREIIKQYGFYITQLTYDEYVAWIRSDRRFAQIYFKTVAEEAYADAMRDDAIILINI